MQKHKILDRIQSPADVKKLDAANLDRLCYELREEIVDAVSRNGGHLAPNLGTVELRRKTKSCGMWGIRLTRINF